MTVSGLGNYVIVYHGKDLVTVYGHLKEVNVEGGDRVLAGEKIGSVGSTGNSSGPHLHFVVKKDGEEVDPMWYLDLRCEEN